MNSSKPLILLLCLLLSLVNCSYIPSVEEFPKGEADDSNAPSDSLQMILTSPNPAIVVDRLRKEGVDFDQVRNLRGFTVLMLAAKLHLVSAVLALLAAGADVALRSPNYYDYVEGWFGLTAAGHARKNNDMILGTVIDNYQRVLQLFLIRQQLMDNPGGAANLPEISLDIVHVITDYLLKLLPEKF